MQNHSVKILLLAIVVLCCQFFFASSSQADSSNLAKPESDAPILRYRYPNISPDGNLIALTVNGDIWVAGLNNSLLKQVTSYPAREIMPIWLPNNKELLYAADYAGNYDVYRIPITGGTPKQLTCYETSEMPYSVSPDGKEFYFYNTREGASDLFIADTFSMKTPARVMQTERISEYHPTISPYGKYLAFTTGGNPHGYRRPAENTYGDAEIWIADIIDLQLSNFRQLTDNQYHDIAPNFVWHPTKNRPVLIYSAYPSGQENENAENGIFIADPLNPNANPNKTNDSKILIASPDKRFPLRIASTILKNNLWHMVVENGFGGINYYVINPATEKIESTKTLDLDVPAVEIDFLNQRVVSRDTIQEYSFSPDNKKVAVVHNGDVFVSSATGGLTEQLTFSPTREFHLCWAKNSLDIYYVTIQNKNADIYSANLKTGEIEPLINSAEHEVMPGLTPDGKYLVYIRNDNELRKFNLKTKKDELIFGDGVFERQGISSIPKFHISNTGKFILFTPKLKNDLNENIWVGSMDGKIKPIKLTHFNSSCLYPAWSEDDRNIVFSANIEHDWDMFALNFQEKPKYFAEDNLDKVLGRETNLANVEDAKKKLEALKAAKKAQTQPAQTQPNKTKPIQAKPVPLKEKYELTMEEAYTWTQYFENAWENMVQITNAPTHEFHPFILGKGTSKKVIYYISDGAQFWSVSVFGGYTSKISTTSEAKDMFKLTPDRNSISYLSNGKITKFLVNRKSNSSISLQFDYEINPVDRKLATYDEAVWVFKNYYYSPEKIKNWLPSAKLYRRMVEGNSNNGEVSNIFFDLLGSLNSSHTGYYPAKSSSNKVNTGSLGLYLDAAELFKNGIYKITKVIKNSPADLAGIKSGNFLLAVNNTKLNATTCLDEILMYKTGKRIILTVAERMDDKNQNIYKIKIKPASRSSIWYLQKDNELEQRVRLVKQTTNDEFGYIHITAMSGAELLKFKKELNKFVNKKGLILDLRGNVGGYTARDILEILTKEPFVLRSFRQFARVSENAYRGYSWEKPIVLLVDEHSVSNAEIFAEGFRELKLGPIIGMPTVGGVIGTGSFRLNDGSSIRLPAWGAFTKNNEDLEGAGRMPDVLVEKEIYSRDKIDNQLLVAIKELRKQVLYFEKFNVRPYKIKPRSEIEPELEKLFSEYQKTTK